jgi:hypothetical protein
VHRLQRELSRGKLPDKEGDIVRWHSIGHTQPGQDFMTNLQGERALDDEIKHKMHILLTKSSSHITLLHDHICRTI